MTVEPVLAVSARCRTPGCPVVNDDVLIDITISNQHSAPVRIAIEYLRKTGPVIRLVDTKTRAETYLRTNLADEALRDHPSTIEPGGAATLGWVIHRDELEHFGRPYDVTAEITIATDIAIDGRKAEFTGSTTLRVTER